MHELKTWPDEFLQIATGAKPFDLRFNDRGFTPNDTLYLQEYDRQKKVYSGKALITQISYVLRVNKWVTGANVDPQWVILGLSNIKLVYGYDKPDVIFTETKNLKPIIDGSQPFCFIFGQEPEAGQTISISESLTTKIVLATITTVKRVRLSPDTLAANAHVVGISNVVYKP